MEFYIENRSVEKPNKEEVQDMKKWSIPVIIAIVALLMPVSSTIANAQDEAGLSIEKSADKTSASPHETITYTYTIVNTDNVTVSNITLEDDKLGAISLTDTTLAPGENITATAAYTVTISDSPGPIVNTATVTGTDPNGTLVSATTDPVSVSLYINKWLLFKAEILKLMGVPGKGIEKAPGLQKPFNPKSQAAEHADKKDKPKTPEQLQIRERVENQSTENQLRIRLEVENHAGSVQATQGDVEAKPGKWQLMKNWNTDNQTGEYETTGNCHKPDKDEPNNKSKMGK
jgi:hypothetical protein